MNNSKTPKIVVGVGLVAVYATVLSILTLRGPHDSAVVESVPSAASAQMVAAPASPPVAIPESADALASEANAPAAIPAPIAPAVTDATKAPEARASVASAPKPRVEDVPIASLPSPRLPAPSDAEELSRSNSGSNAVSDLAATSEAVPSESVTSAEDTSSDEDSESATVVSPAAIGN
jgi:hypothetical protein